MVFEGLRDWFWINHRAAGRKLSMPSQVVDDAWHEFILFTRNYEDFCKRGVGRFLHHVPAEAWVRAAEGHKPSLDDIVKHCELDVLATEELFYYFKPYIVRITR